ncbi:DoxX family protein [Streptomyces sp. NPDC001260]|uniref:DoxX family protein n=1 Tax=Streptomyces sp. NPDC001260 TaxID=3364551 RepID=UPI00369DC0E6
MSETTVPVTSTSPAASAASGSLRGRRARIALRTVQVLLALFYGVASALPKLIGNQYAVDAFDRIGWGGVGMYTIGALELAGAVALLIPVLQSVAAVALSALMVGAFFVQMIVFGGENAATPLILIVPLAVIAWARRDSNRDLLDLVRRRG